MCRVCLSKVCDGSLRSRIVIGSVLFIIGSYKDFKEKLRKYPNLLDDKSETKAEKNTEDGDSISDDKDVPYNQKESFQNITDITLMF